MIKKIYSILFFILLVVSQSANAGENWAGSAKCFSDIIAHFTFWTGSVAVSNTSLKEYRTV